MQATDGILFRPHIALGCVRFFYRRAGAYMYKHTQDEDPIAQNDGWILVSDHLPPAHADVEVIGRNYGLSELHIGTATFDPTRGWHGMTNVYAWKNASCTLKMLQDSYPAKRIY